jgi:thiamine biosynthesis lipoprotein
MVATAHWRALGTSVHVVSHGLDPERAREAVVGVLCEVDATYSRFRADSELRRLQDRRDGTGRTSPLLALAIETALDAARRTDGAVDPTIGRAIRAIGYDDDFARVGAGTAITIRLADVPGWQVVRFDARSRTLRLPTGVELDLGSTGKALAADLAAAAAMDAGALDAGALDAGALDAVARDCGEEAGVLVSLGGDIATAGRPPAGGWRILAAEDSETSVDAEGEVVAIDGGAIATSSTRVRRWHTRGGVEMHHLIDPRTGAPTAGPWRTASVVAGTCVEANTAATAAIVLGENGIAWLEAAGMPARLVDNEGGVTRINGWPDPGPAPEAARA